MPSLPSREPSLRPSAVLANSGKQQPKADPQVGRRKRPLVPVHYFACCMHVKLHLLPLAGPWLMASCCLFIPLVSFSSPPFLLAHNRTPP